MTKLLLSLQVGLVILVVILGLQGMNDSREMRDQIRKLQAVQAETLDAVAGAKAPAGVPASLVNAVRRTDTKVQEILTTLEWLAIDVDAIKRYAWDTLQALQSSEGQPEPEAPNEYKALFNPETRAALAALAKEKGVRLFDGRVEVPGVLIQNRVMLEFFAVVSGGKEHESIIALTGSFDRENREGKVPEGLAGMINACILALGYEKGTPVRASRDGKVLPPEGEAIFVYVEWDDPETGERVRARAEDLVYNVKTMKAMARKRWVYVGSRFERDWGSGDVVYLADVTGDVVATYSWPNTIIDNTTSEGSDDIYYACFTDRLPEVGAAVTMVFSKEEMKAKEFPPPKTPEENGGDDSDK